MKRIIMMMAVKSWTMAWLVAAAILFLIARQADCRFTFNCSSPRTQQVDNIRGRVRYHMIKFSCTCSESVSLRFEKTLLGDRLTNLAVRDSALNYEEKFNVTPKHDDIYHVEATLTFPYFNHVYYSGTYILRGCSSADPSICVISPKALIVGLQPDYHLPLSLTCYRPDVFNISANFKKSNDHLVVYLYWNATTRVQSDKSYCNGSRRWRVGYLRYDTAEAVLSHDRDVVGYKGITWVDRPRVVARNTDYTFERDEGNELSNNSYYVFYVGHREDKLKDAISLKYGSIPYFFGQQRPASIDPRMVMSYNVKVSENLRIKCHAVGFPKPKVKWIGTLKEVSTLEEDPSVLVISNARMSHSGDYHCVASNIITNPERGMYIERDVVVVQVTVEDYHVNETGVICEDMKQTGTVCSAYLQPSLKIFKNISVQIAEQENLIPMNLEQYIGDTACFNLAQSIICHQVYPYCSNAPGISQPRPVCAKACQEFISGSCSKYFDHVKHLQFAARLRDGCDSSYTEGGDLPECIPLSLEASKAGQVDTVPTTGTCMRGDGRGYRGTVAVTQSGVPCQSWNSQSPHQHPMAPGLFISDLDDRYNPHHGYCRNPGGLGRQPWCYTTKTTLRWEYCNITKCDTCAAYTGSLCSNIDGYSSRHVLVRKIGRLYHTQEDIEDTLNFNHKSITTLPTSTPGCDNIVRLLLCHSGLPLCVNGSSDQAMLACSDHCHLLQLLQVVCPLQFSRYQEVVSDHGDVFISPNCPVQLETMPSHCMAVTDKSLNAAAHGPDSQSNQTTGACDTLSNGVNVSVTVSGRTCLRWSSKSLTGFKSEWYPELTAARNHCRNPGRLRSSTWCFSSPGVVEDCNMTGCQTGQDATRQPGGVTDESGKLDGNFGATFGVIIGVLAIVGVLGGVAVAIVVVTLRSQKLEHVSVEGKKNLARLTTSFSESKYVTNPEYKKHQVPTANSSRSVVIPDSFQLIPKDTIKYISQLGQGNFGIVYKGKAIGLVEGDEEVEVAVKTLKEDAGSEVRSDFIEEAKLMFGFSHPNILKIYGVCMSDFPYLMVFEYMDEGDLTQFLRNHASSVHRRLLNPFSFRSRTESSYSDDPPSLTKTQLLHICKQVAAGMAYLSSLHHVHRDLACRNCLVDSSMSVKIGDFGMSRKLYSKDYYRINGQAVLPVRWMSPEALIYGKFSVEGDVWSFGVVMWEVFSFALQPYYGISNEEVTEAIRRGKTLKNPEDCPSEIYELMKECWSMDPQSRPSFDELHHKISHYSQLASVSDDKDKAEILSVDSVLSSDAFTEDEYSEEELAYKD